MKIKKLIIILGCCIITLFSLVFVGCKRNKANANVISGSYLLELPFLTTTLNGSDIVIPNMYLGEDNVGTYIYYITTGTGTSETSSYVKSYFNEQIGLNYAYNNIDVSNYNHTNFNWLTNVANGFSTITKITIGVTGDNTINYIVNNAVTLNVICNAGTLEYMFYDVNNNLVGDIYISNLKFVGAINEIFYSFNVLLGELTADDIDIVYNDGYQDGYVYGYSNGYTLGVEQGFGATTPFDVFTDTIGRFLDIELFGGFKISTLFYIGFGMILLGIVIKVFLGG